MKPNHRVKFGKDRFLPHLSQFVIHHLPDIRRYIITDSNSTPSLKVNERVECSLNIFILLHLEVSKHF
jgi:hypothetical protein